MSKLFKLKEWLTVPDSARYLSIAFGEDVTEPDVLRLALDGHLKLSVNFVNHARAKRGKVVSRNDTEWIMFPNLNRKATENNSSAPVDVTPDKIKDYPPDLLAKWFEIPENERGNFFPLLMSLNIDNLRFLTLDKKVTSIMGVWDLSMIGGEELDIEHRYQLLTGGPAVTLEGMNGAFVERDDGLMYQLQSDFDDNEYQTGSTAQLKKLKKHIESNKIKGTEAQKLLDTHKHDRKIFLEKRASEDNSHKYFPAGGLTEDSVLVVRTAALRDFEQSINDTPKLSDKAITTTERNTLLAIIAGLCDYSAINPSERGVADKIAVMTQEYGAEVSSETIRKVLAKIPAALVTRMK